MLSAIISALPKILALINIIMTMVRDKEQQGLGRAEAVAEALDNAHKDIAYANSIEEEAVQSHNASPDSDDGFDTDYRRPD